MFILKSIKTSITGKNSKKNHGENNGKINSKNELDDSKLYVLRNSGIHHKGLFASRDIKKGDKIIQYVGEVLTKKESNIRADETIEKAKKDKNNGFVYLFELNDKYDIDGNVPYNVAKYINHSCNPNCESNVINDEIWVMALRDINKGDELSYDYGYDTNNFLDHPCRCGSTNCFGFIVNSDKWKKVIKTIKNKLLYKKVLVVYYSRTGTTKKAVSFLKQRFDFDLDELYDSKNRKGFVRYVIAGKDALLKADTDIRKSYDPKDYDLVIVAGPVWAGNMPPAIRKYVYQHKDDIKNVLFLCTLGGDKPENFLLENKKLFGDKFKGFLSLNKKVVVQNKHFSLIINFLLEKLGKK